MKKIGISQAFSLLWKFADKKEKFFFVSLFFLTLFRAVPSLLYPIITACFVAKIGGGSDVMFLGINMSSLSLVWLIVLLFVIYYISATAATFIRAGIKRMGAKMLVKTNSTGLAYILENRKNSNLGMTNGEASYIVKNASERIYEFVENFLTRVLTPIISSITAIIYISLLDGYAFLILLCTIVLVFISMYVRVSREKRCFKNIENINGKISNHLLNNIDNMPYISFFKTKFHEQEILDELNNEYYSQEKKRIRHYIFYWVSIYCVEFLCSISIMFLLTRNISNPTDVANSVIVLLPYLSTIFSNFDNMAHTLSMVNQSAIKFCRISYLECPKEEIMELPDKNSVLPKDEPIEKIEVQDMTLHVGTFTKEHVNALFEKGKMTCIIGGSGSGKTTLINSLLGLKEYETGKIVVNDEYELKSFYFESDRFSVTTQDGAFFDRSLVKNLAYPNDELSEEGKKIASTLQIDNLIKRKKRLDHDEVFKNSYSGGEKKRFSFVRAMSKKAEVYVLDEPTNELDSTNVRKVISLLKKARKNAIVIVISHDSRVIDASDNLLIL